MVLISPQPTPYGQEFAAFVGAAALYDRQQGEAPLLRLAPDLMPVTVE